MDFVVAKDNLVQTRVVPSPPLVLQDGDVLIRVVKFAFTANNVSYAATGDALGYWKFFPATSCATNTTFTTTTTTCRSTEEKPAHNNNNKNNEGRVPVWGVGVIVASRCCPRILFSNNRRRVYGYFPMSHYVVLHPVQVTVADFVDGMKHRRSLPAVYNQYLFCDEDPFYTPRTEDAMMVLRPLFFTSWLLVDFLSHPTTSCNDDDRQQQERRRPFFGATTVIISSASSKTSIGLAFLLYQNNQQQQQPAQQPKNDAGTNNIRIVGLTSARHSAFVESLQIYDQIILYDDLEQQLDATQPTCFVDMAGNTKLTTRLHHHLGEQNAKYTCLVGAAHLGHGGKPTGRLPGARPKFFFAPSWTAQRVQELGRNHITSSSSSGGYGRGGHESNERGLKILLHRVLLDYQHFVNWCLGAMNHNLLEEGNNGKQWLHMKYYFGQSQMAQGYTASLQGEIDPDTAVIMSLWDDKDDERELQMPPPAPACSKL